MCEPASFVSWSDHFAGTLKKQDFDRSVACPTLFRDNRNSILVLHVDDIQAAGKSSNLEPKLSKLRETYELKVECPFLTEQELEVGESHQTIRFLKRKFSYHNHELHITSDPKYLTKLKEELKLTTKASKPTPCTQESQEAEKTQPLDQEQAATFRTCVGILLYIGQDRPDVQFAVRGLASKMSEPTHSAQKHLVHLVQYMAKTEGYHLVYRKTPRGLSNLHESIRNGSYAFSTTPAKDHHLLEVFSDSDWAGRQDTRRSTSSGTIFLDGQCFYSFSRNQKSVSLSSGEAEYYAGASAASDSILLQEAVKFLTQRNCKVHLHMDSSAARGIITRQGVGRVKHLQVRTLFLQDLHKQGTISVHPVGTKESTSDIGTKPLSAKRIRLLLHWLGFQTSAQVQAKAAVRMIKRQGSLSFAALLFAGISVVSEGLQRRSFQEEFSQEQCFQQDSFQNFKEVSFSMSACVQDVMSADTSACALGTCVGTVADMSACALGSESMCEGTYAEMLSQLKELTSSLLSRQGLDLEDLGTMSEAASSSKSIKEQREEMTKVREALERNTEQMSLLLSSHSKLNATVQEMSSETKSLRWTVQELQEDTERQRNATEIRLSELAGVVDNLSEKFAEVVEDLCEQRNAEGNLATEEEKEQDERERKEFLKARKEEAEHRREGHLREEEFSDKGLFEKILEQEQEYEDYMGNEMYTQSYTGPTEEEYPGEEEEEAEEEEEEAEEEAEEEEELTEEEKKKLEEEQEEERKRKIKEINRKNKEKAKEKEKEMEGFEYPYDYSDEWKEYTEDGHIYKQHRVTGERKWIDVDHKYKHQKGQGKGKEKGKEGKGKEKQAKPEEEGQARGSFEPRDEEDRQYWAKIDKMEEEKRQKREEAAEEKRKEEEKKAFARKKLEEAAAEQERRDKEAEAAAEELKRKKEAHYAAKAEEEKAAAEAAARAQKEQERKQREKEARKKREQEQKAAAAHVAKKQAEREEAEAAAKGKESSSSQEDDRIKKLEKIMESLLEERAKDKEKIKELEEEVRSRTGSQGTEEEPAAAAEEQTPAAGKEEKPGTQDPHLSAVGPINEGSFAKGKGREDCFANEGDWFAVYSFQGTNYQWKWNEKMQYWYWFRGTGQGWAKGTNDRAGKQKCQAQEKMRDEWLESTKGKGKKEGEGKNKGKGSDEVIEIKEDDDEPSYQ